MKNWSLGYEIIKTYVRFAFWLSHRRVVVTGRHLIPKGKPIIFAPNHQNALMDPLALACTNHYQTVWLARADIFKSKSTDSILRYLKLLPVYRIRDGKDNLSNNERIFSQVTHILENKQTIALFPEAAHSGKRQMLPHKKAIPRIALEAEEKNNFNLGLQIVPVGIYYDHYWAFNRSLLVQYGEPIEIDKYKEEYTEYPQKAMLSLRDEIYERLSPLTIQINSETYYQEYENIRHLAGKALSRTHSFNENQSLNLFYAEKELISRIEQLEKKHPDQFDSLIEETTEYFEAVKAAGLTDERVRKADQARWSLFFVHLFSVLLTLPIFIFGFVFNSIPLFIPRKLLHRKVKDLAFLSTFNFVVGLIFFPLFYLVVTILLFAFTDSLSASASFFILMPLGGKIAYQLLVFYRDVVNEFTFLAGGKSRRKAIKGLVHRRNEQINSILEKSSF